MIFDISQAPLCSPFWIHSRSKIFPPLSSIYSKACFPFLRFLLIFQFTFRSLPNSVNTLSMPQTLLLHVCSFQTQSRFNLLFSNQKTCKHSHLYQPITSFIEQPSKVFLIGFFDGVELYQSLNYPFEDCFQVSSLSFPLHYLYFFLFHSNLLVRQAAHSFVYVVFPLCSLQAIVPSICNQIYYSLQNRKHSFSLLFPSFIDTFLHQWQ